MENEVNFKPAVVVTGFGSFAGVSVNASWEGVRRMNKEELEKEHNIELFRFEIPVLYEQVDTLVPALWETHAPKLTIHAGVSTDADCFTLEAIARRKGYTLPDYQTKCPADYCCPADGPTELYTKLDVEQICKEFNDISTTLADNTKAVTSKEAGRYLCEYIYYSSLSVDDTRTLFVHVPDLPCYSADQTARGLERILAVCLKQIREQDNLNGGAATADEKRTNRIE